MGEGRGKWHVKVGCLTFVASKTFWNENCWSVGTWRNPQSDLVDFIMWENISHRRDFTTNEENVTAAGYCWDLQVRASTFLLSFQVLLAQQFVHLINRTPGEAAMCSDWGQSLSFSTTLPKMQFLSNTRYQLCTRSRIGTCSGGDGLE